MPLCGGDEHRRRQAQDKREVQGRGADDDTGHDDGPGTPTLLQGGSGEHVSADSRRGDRLPHGETGQGEIVRLCARKDVIARAHDAAPDLAVGRVRQRLQRKREQDPPRLGLLGQPDELPRLRTVQHGRDHAGHQQEAEQVGTPVPPVHGPWEGRGDLHARSRMSLRTGSRPASTS